jgi:hypothetical protein
VPVLKTIENFGFGDRFIARVIDSVDRAALGHDKAQNDSALWPFFSFNAKVVEAARIPESDKVAMNSLFAINITLLRKDQGT